MGKTQPPGRAAQAFHLIVELVKRDVRARFMGSALGLSWTVLQPLTLLALYWFVFTFMIPRTPTPGTGNYALFLISGLIPWIAMSEGIVRGTTSIVENAPLVRRLTFRSEILVFVPNLTAILFEIIGLSLVLGILVLRGYPIKGLWVLPFAIVAQLVLQSGVAFFLAALYVFFRDVIQVLGFFLTIVFYLSPILYPVEGRFAELFFWNPLTALFGLFRTAILAKPLPDARSIVFLLAVTAGILFAGLTVFRRAQRNFADLI